MGRFARRFEPYYEGIRENIFTFCEAMNFTPTWQQAKVLELVQQGHKRIAVKSGQGLGKTAVSVIVGLWRSIRAFNALTVVTAPTMRQAKQVWLAEARRMLEKADPIIQKFVEATKSAVNVAGRTDWGVKLITATKSENAQGIHQDNLTFIAEEASGIQRDLIEQIEGTLSNEDALFLMIGNPNTRDCAFFDCFNNQRHRWATLTLNTEESPLVSKENINYLSEKYGVDSDVYRIRVKGEFPLQDPNCVISSEDVEACTETDPYPLMLLPRNDSDSPAKQFGLDFARFGADESVIYRRSGLAIVEWETYAHKEPSHVVERAFRMQSDAGWRDEDCWYVADAGGMGQGVMSKFHDASKNTLEFHNNGKASHQDYDNKITEGWFLIAGLVKKRKLWLPKDNRLIQQLSGRQYHTTKAGKLILESKDDYKKRSTDEVGGSPDRADALVLCYYDGVVSGGAASGRDNDGYRVGRRLRMRGAA